MRKTVQCALVAVAAGLACGAPAQEPGDFRQLRLSAGASPGDVTAADLDGDGRLDLVVAAAGTLTVFRGDGAGGFRRSSAAAAGEGPTGLVTGDFDEDGRIDVLTANHETRYVTLLFGDGKGGLEARPGSRIEVEVSPHTHAVAAGDVNEDGHLDFLVDDRGAHAVKLFPGRGDGSFGSPHPVEVGGDPYRGMFLGDLDGDGHLDLATPNPREVAVFLGDGEGGFQSAPGAPHPVPAPFSITVADVNGDGIPDLAASPGEGSTELTVLPGRGDGGFRDALSIGTAGGAGSVAAADLDGDGFDDLVVTAYVADRVDVVFGGEAGLSTSAIDVARNPWGVWAGDLDGDGRGDFVTANQGSDDVSVFLSGRRGGEGSAR